jgi:hypothetical protein
MPGFGELGRLDLQGYSETDGHMPAEDGAEAPYGTSSRSND